VLSWAGELERFAVHAAAAAALLLLLLVLGPLRSRLAGAVRGVACARRGTVVAAVLTLTLATRLALLPAVHPVYEADIREYVEKAVAIAQDGNPRSVETRADGSHFYRPLGYSLPLAGWYRVTGVPASAQGRVRSAQVLNVLAACAVAWLLLALGAAAGREAAGRIAALAYALHLPAVVFCLLPYTETWATLTFAASALCFERLRRGDLPRGRALALGAGLGVSQGLLLITRTEFAWLPALTAGLLLWERRRDLARAAVPVTASLAFVLVPFAVNHEMRAGYPGHLRTSVQGGLILYFGNNPIEVNGYGNATPPVAAHVRELYARDPTGGLARDEAIAWMKEHPFEVLLNAPKKLYHLWLAEPQGFGWHIQAGRDPGTDRSLAGVLRHAAWVQSLALLGAGLLALRWRERSQRFWILALALHAATWCLLAASTRNRYPLEPLLLTAVGCWPRQGDPCDRPSG
jgi:hypothetical protein